MSDILSTISFLIGLNLPIIGLFLFVRFLKHKTLLQLGTLLGITHFLFIIFFVASIEFVLERDPELGIGYFVLMFIDFPSLLVFGFLYNLFFKSYNSMLPNFYLRLFVFAILGSLQYFFIGMGIGWLYKKWNQRRT